MTIIDARKASLLFRVKQFGGPLNELPVLAQFLAEVRHDMAESKGHLASIRDALNRRAP